MSILNILMTVREKGISRDQNNHVGEGLSLKALEVGDTYLLSCQFYSWGETVTKELAFGCIETVKEERVINLSSFHFKFQDTIKTQP